MKCRELFLVFVWISLQIWPPTVKAQASGQEGPSSRDQVATSVRVGSSVDPDTVLVGQPFTLGISVQASPGAQVQLPKLLQLGDELEQQGPAEIRQDTESGQWRAYYPLVAWTSGLQKVPPIEVRMTGEEADRLLHSQPHSVLVVSVLPAGEKDLELRGARPFLKRGTLPWLWILLGAALLAALGIWYWRRRQRAVPVATPRSVEAPGERALRQLAALRREWEADEVGGQDLFDQVESTLRTYAAATRTWRPGRPLRQLANGNRTLAEALNRSALVRFARLGVSGAAPLRSIEGCEKWIRAEQAARTAAEPAPTTQTASGDEATT